MPKFKDIPQFTQDSPYNVDQSVRYIDQWLVDAYIKDYGLQMCPDFQRGHVWTEAQQIAYVEYLFQGGKSGLDIYFNDPEWQSGKGGKDFVLVDGLQRLTAVLRFVHNEIPIFGHFYRDFTDKMPFLVSFRVHVNTLQTKAEVLRWYVEMNSGGTPHTQAEIDRVKAMWEAETAKKGKK